MEIQQRRESVNFYSIWRRRRRRFFMRLKWHEFYVNKMFMCMLKWIFSTKFIYWLCRSKKILLMRKLSVCLKYITYFYSVMYNILTSFLFLYLVFITFFQSNTCKVSFFIFFVSVAKKILWRFGLLISVFPSNEPPYGNSCSSEFSPFP